MNRVFNLFLLCLFLVVLAVPDAMAATTPSRQAGRLSMTTTGITAGKQFKLQWRSGDGNGNIVVAREATGQTFTNPSDNVDYDATVAGDYSGNLASGNDNIGDGVILYVGANHEVEISGLTPGTDYTFMVYEYQSDAPGNIAYSTSQRLTNPATFTAPAAALANDALDAASEIDQHVAWIDWDIANANGGAIYLQVATDANFTQMVAGYSFLNIGNQDHWTLFGLTGGTQYWYRVSYIANGVMAPWYEATFTTDAATAPTITFANGDASAANAFPTTAVAQSHNGNTYAITLTFDEIMDWAFEPTITVDPDGANGAQNTLTFLYGEWSPVDDDNTFPFDTKYTAYYSVDGTSNEEFTQDAFFDVAADAQDYAGVNNNAVTDDAATQVFTIDTKSPGITAASITGATCLMNADNLAVSVQATDAGYGDLDNTSFNYGTTANIANETDLNTNKSNPVAGNDVTVTSTAAIGADLSGSYTFDYTVTDDAGNFTSNTVAFTVDNTNPSTPVVAFTSGQCNDGTGNVVFTVTVSDEGGCGTWDETNLDFTGSTGATNWAATIGTATSQTGTGTVADPYVYTFTLALDAADANGDYDIVVTATDPAGNTGASSTTVTFTVDENNPVVNSVTIERLADNTSDQNISDDGTAAADLRVTVRVTDTGECGDFGSDVENQTGAAQLLFTKTAGSGTCTDMLGGAGGDAIAALVSATETGAGTNVWDLVYDFDVNGETEGDIDFSVEAIDKHANTSGATDVAVSLINIDNSDPTFAGGQPALTNDPGSACYDAGDASIAIGMTIDETANIESTLGDLTNANISVTNVSGPQTLTWAKAAMAGVDGAWTQTVTCDISGFDNTYTGDYVIEVVATDEAGNTVTSNTESFSIDNTAPSITSAVFKDSPVVGAGTEVSCASVGQTVYLHLTLSEVGCGTMDGALANAAGGIVINSGDFTDNLVKHANETVTNPSYVFVYETTIDAGDAAGLHTVNYDLSDSKVNTLAGQEVSITIDKTAPTIVGPTISDASSCYGTGAKVTFTVTAIDPPVTCGTFDETNLSVWLETDDNQTNDGAPDRDAVFVSKSGNTYTYEYTIVAGDATTDFDIVVIATDESGNSNTPSDGLGRAIDAVSVDRTDPVIDDVANVAGNGSSNSCIASGDQVTFEVPVSDVCSGDVTVDSVYLHSGAQDIELVLNDTYTYSTVDDKIYVTYTAAGTETENVLVTVEAFVTDAAGNNATLDQDADFYFDFTAPTITALEPTGFAAGDCFKTGETVSFSIPASEDQCDDPFLSLTLKDLDGDVITTGTDQANGGFTSIGYNDGTKEFDVVYTIQGTEDQGLCTIEAVVTDAAGNAATTQTTSDLFSIDYTGPAIAGFAFSNAYYTDLSATVNDATITVNIVEAGTCTFDGSDVTASLVGSTSGDVTGTKLTLASMTQPTPGNYVLLYTIDLSGATDTETMTFDISALDAAGNASNDPAADDFIVDNSTAIVDNYTTIGDCASGTLTFTFDVDAGVSGVSTITFTETSAADPVQSGGVVGNTYTYTLDVSGDADGPYNMVINVTDMAGNVTNYTPDAGAEYTVDQTGPSSVTIAETSSGCLTDGDDLVFTVTIADAGCAILADWAAGDVVVDGSVTGLSNWGVAPAITQPASDIVYTYTIPIAAGDATGSYTIGADVTDPNGNGPTAETSVVTTYVDNDEPVFANFVVDQQDACVISGNITGSFTLTDAGCGDVTGLTVTLDFTTAADVELTVGSGITDLGGGSYTYSYTTVGNEGDGVVDVYVDADDTKGNSATQEDNGDTDLTLDFTGPQNVAISRTDAEGNCLSDANGNIVIEVTADVDGCATVDANSVTLSGLWAGATPSVTNFNDAGAPSYVWTYTYAVPAGNAGLYDNVYATVDDGLHSTVNSAALAAFTIDNDIPSAVTAAITGSTCLRGGENLEFTVTITDANTCGGWDASNVVLSDLETALTNYPNPANHTLNITYPDANTVLYTYSIPIVIGDGSGPRGFNAVVTDPSGNGPIQADLGVYRQFTLDNSQASINVNLSNTPTCLALGETIEVIVTATNGGCYTDVTPTVELDFGNDGNNIEYLNVASSVSGNDYTFTYTTVGTETSGDVKITAYVNKGEADQASYIDAFTVQYDKTPAAITVDIVSTCEVPGQIVLPFTVDDDADNCSPIDNTNIEVVFSSGAWSHTVPTDGGSISYDNGTNAASVTYTIPNNTIPQGTPIAMTVNVTDVAGNPSTATDNDAFTVDYAGPVVSNIVLSETCVKYTEDLVPTPTTVVNATFHVEEEGCGTFDKTNIVASALNNLTTINAVQADIVVAAGQTSGYDVTVPFVIPDNADQGAYTITLVIDDHLDNFATMADATGTALNADITVVPTFSVDNDSPTITALTLDPADAGACLTTGATVNGTVAVTQTGCSEISTVTVYFNFPADGQDRSVVATLADDAENTDLDNDFIYEFTTDIILADGNGDVDVYATATDGLATVSADFGIGGTDFSLDQIAPQNVAIASAQDGGCYNDTQTITLTVSADIDAAGCLDETGVVINFTGLGDLNAVESNGQPTGPVGLGNTYTWEYTIDIPANGQTTYDGLYTVAATVNDGNGAVATAGNITFTVDNVGPIVSNIAFDQTCVKYTEDLGQNPTTVVNATFHVEENGCGTFDATNITADARTSWFGPFVISGVVTNIDGVTPPTGYDVTVAFTVPSNALDGPYQLELTIADDNNNVADIDPLEDPATGFNDGIIYSNATFSIDNDAPSITDLTITQAGSCLKGGSAISGTVTVSQTGCSPIQDVTVYLDMPGGMKSVTAGAPTGDVYPFTYTIVEGDDNGDVDVYATATDGLGSTTADYEQGNIDLSVDQLAPDAANLAKVTAGTCFNDTPAQDSIIFAFTVTEVENSTGCTFDETNITSANAVTTDGIGETISPSIVVTDLGVDTWGVELIYIIDGITVDGSYDITINMTDDAGNAGTGTLSMIDAFVLDNSPAPITELVVDNCEKASVDYSFTINDTDCAGDNENDATVTILDDQLNPYAGPINVSYNAGYSGTLDVTGYASGTYTLKVDYTDDSNNPSVPAMQTFNVDNVGPVVAVIDLNTNCVKDGETVTMTFAVTDNDICSAIASGNISAEAVSAGTTITGSNITLNAGVATVDFVFPAQPQVAHNQGVYNVTLTIADNLTNTATMGDASGVVNVGDASIIDVVETFTLDNTGPVVAFGSFTNPMVDDCYKANEAVSIAFTVNDASCGGAGATPVVTITLPNATTVQPTVLGVAPNFTATYTPINTVGTGTATIDISGDDGLGNLTTENGIATFSIDNSAPEISNFTLVSNADCYKAGQTVTFGFEISDPGCATFDQNDIDIQFNGLTPLNFTNLGYNAGNSLWEFSYLVDANDNNGAVSLTISVEDIKLMSGSLSVATAFSIDTESPALALVNTPPTCVEVGDVITFHVNASDAGCGTFDENDIVVTVDAGVANNISAVTPVAGVGYNYEFTYTVAQTDLLPVIKINAADDLLNAALEVTHAITVDTEPLTLVVDLPQVTCVSNPLDNTFDFGITATNNGCDQAINNLTVTVTPAGGNATPVSENLGTYSYAIPAGSEFSGQAVITVTANDGFGNLITETANFTIDNAAPVLSNYVDNADCVGTPNVAAFGTEVSFSITAEDFGCSTFAHGDIVVHMTNSGGPLVNTPQLDVANTNGNTYAFTYIVDSQDLTGDVDITFDLTDSKNNAAVQYAPVGIEFSIDNTAPTLALSADKSCVLVGDQVTFTLNAIDLGCASFDESNISAAIVGDANAQLSAITQALDGSLQPIPNQYTFTYTVSSEDSGILTVNVNAMDAVGNIANQETIDITVDTEPLTLVVDLPQVTCVSNTIDNTFDFGITATNNGCDMAINNLSVTVTPFGGVATPVVDNNGTYSYAIPAGSAYTGEALITVTATDGFGHLVTETANFNIDNTAPVLSNYLDDADCIGAPNVAAMLTEVSFSITADDLGCGTFVQGDIVVNMTNTAGQLVNTVQIDAANSNGNVFAYKYLVDPQDLTGDVNITFDLMDTKGNIATQYSPEGIEFSIDNTAPVLSNLNVSKTNAVEGDVLTFTFDLLDAGCSTTQEPTVNLTFSDNSTTTATYVSGSGNGTYTYSYTVPQNPVEGGVNLVVMAQDANLNMGVLDPANYEFVIISNTPANVTSITVNDIFVEDSDAGNNFVVTVNYDQVMDVTQNAPVITFDPTAGGTFTAGVGSWTNGNQTYNMTYTIVDADICADDIDVSVTGGQNTVGIVANNGQEADLFNIFMCAAANARADIIALGNEAATGISSLKTSTITTNSDGQVVWKLQVRDDIISDDSRPTYLNGLTLTAGVGNTAAFDTYINDVALFNGSSVKLANAASITAGAITFNGLNITCPDNGTYDIFVVLSLKTALPNGDGSRFVFNVNNTNTVQTGTPTTTFTVFDHTSSAAATNNTIVVTGTKLAFTTQPTTTTVGDVATNVVVELQDVNGNKDINGTGNVSMAITNTTTITAGSTEMMINGVATFDELVYGFAATGVTLTATATGGLTPAVSNQFNVSATMPNQISGLTYQSRTKYSISMYWTNSARSIVLAQQGATIDYGAGPVNGTYYNWNSLFDQATEMIGQAKVVYVGSNSGLTVGGLLRNTAYTFAVFSFNSDGSMTPSTIVYNPTNPGILTKSTSYFKDYMGLDVEMRNFDVTSSDVKAFLDWETIKETDNVGFEVHRAEMTAAGLEPFEMISSYEDNSALAGLNQSEFGKRYKLTDDDAVLTIGATYIYRLVSVASDGYKAIQAEQSVKINGAASMTMSEIQPNPVVSDLAFDLDMNEAREITIQIYSVEGTLVAQPILTKEYSMGLHKVKIDLDRANVPAGTYTLKVIAGDNEMISKRFVVVR